MGLKEQAQERITALVTFLVTSLSLCAYGILRGLGLWTRIDATIPKSILWISTALLLISTVSVSAWVFSLNRKTKKSVPTSIGEFRIAYQTGTHLHLEVWYYYDGALGGEGIECEAEPIDKSGRRVELTQSYESGIISVIGHRALAEMSCAAAHSMPPDQDFTSTHLKFTMRNAQGVVFYEKTVPHVKVWRKDSPKP
jgi:hypothetical protein